MEYDNNIIQNNSKCFALCECNTHAFFVEKYPEDNHVYFSMFELSYNGRKLSFVGKLKWCWQILKTGKPFTDSFILTTENSKNLAQFLLK